MWPFPVLWPRSIYKLQLEWKRQNHSWCLMSQTEKSCLFKGTHLCSRDWAPVGWCSPSVPLTEAPLPWKSHIHPVSAFLTHLGEGGGLSSCWPQSPSWLSAPGFSPSKHCGCVTQSSEGQEPSSTWQTRRKLLPRWWGGYSVPLSSVDGQGWGKCLLSLPCWSVEGGKPMVRAHWGMLGC